MAPIAPERTDGVVILRAFRPDDVDEMVVMARDPVTVRYASGIPHTYEQPPGGDRPTLACWAIAVDGRFAGSLDLRGHPPEIGYVLAPWARGRGCMTRAVRLATRWAFEEAGLPVVHWRTQAGHLASWRVAHACGFTFHGELPLAIAHRGELRDAWHAVLRPTDDGRPRTTWWPTPVLEDDRVRLRPGTDADVPRIADACRDPRTRHWLPDLPDPYTEDHARTFLRQGALESSLGQRVGWVVADPADDRLLARVSIFRLNDPMNPTGAEIGYWAHPDARGRGVIERGRRARGGARVRADRRWRPGPPPAADRHGVGQRGQQARRRARGLHAGGPLPRDGIVGRGEFDDGAWYELLR